MERIEPALQVGELETLCQFLDAQRAGMVRLVEGLSAGQLATTLPSSDLTLAGLLKHLALVEDSWWHEDFLGQALGEPWGSVDWDADPDWEFRTAVDDDPADLVALYAAACDRARQVVAGADGLDALSVGVSRREESRGQQYSLRWILLHLIEETARHLGHADLIRQSIDGATDL